MRQLKNDFSVIVSETGDYDVKEIKQKIKAVCKETVGAPCPKKMLLTKDKQVNLKVKSRKESERLKDLLITEDSLRKIIKVNIPR